MSAYQAKKILSVNNMLGESPIWQPELECLIWLDILSNTLYKFNPKNEDLQQWILPFVAGAVLLSSETHIVLLVSDEGIMHFDLRTAQHANLCAYPEDKTLTRPNEAKVDPYGNIIFGTIGYDPEKTLGNIYCFNETGLRKVYSKIHIINTFVWQPLQEGYQVYFFDSFLQRCYVASYAENITSLEVKEAFEFQMSSPDGSAVDIKETLWTACWGEKKIINMTFDGNIQNQIDVAAVQPASCIFGGENYSTLFITTSNYELKGATVNDGALYSVNLPVKGKPEYRVKRELYNF